MRTLKQLKYRNVDIKILQDHAGTGYKIGIGRAVWLDENNVDAAVDSAKKAVDKKFGL